MFIDKLVFVLSRPHVLSSPVQSCLYIKRYLKLCVRSICYEKFIYRCYANDRSTVYTLDRGQICAYIPPSRP